MLTTHVASQGLAEELKRSGWPQEGSTFYWLRQGGSEWIIVQHMLLETYLDDTGHLRFSTRGNTEVIAAPLASELMERMPPEVEAHRYEDADTKNWVAVLRVEDDWSKYHHLEVADTLPDALAKLALHLIQENKLNLE